MNTLADKQFTEFLWKMPDHWFSEFNNGIRVMRLISYALYQGFCNCYKYEFGVFDLANEEDRRVTIYLTKNIAKPKSDDNQKMVTYYLLWGYHPEDWKILLPIFQREKKKYLQLLDTKLKLLK